ncbi:MAG: hypothetical protein ACI8W8_001679 [Rhodothermales bacterium]|jgi:hypothetical protein
MNTPDSPHLDACMEQLALVQQRLAGFVRALLPNPGAADKVLQETNIVIWQKFDPDRPMSVFCLALTGTLRFSKHQAVAPGIISGTWEALSQRRPESVAEHRPELNSSNPLPLSIAAETAPPTGTLAHELSRTKTPTDIQQIVRLSIFFLTFLF